MDWETEQSDFLRNIEEEIILHIDQFRGPAVESSQKTDHYHDSDFLLDNHFEEQHAQPIKQVDKFSLIVSDTISPVLMTHQSSSQEDKEFSSNHHHVVTKARMVHWKPNIVTPAKLTKNDNNR